MLFMKAIDLVWCSQLAKFVISFVSLGNLNYELFKSLQVK